MVYSASQQCPSLKKCIRMLQSMPVIHAPALDILLEADMPVRLSKIADDTTFISFISTPSLPQFLSVLFRVATPFASRRQLTLSTA